MKGVEFVKKPVIWVVVGVMVLCLISGIGMYNGMVADNENIDNKWGDVENYLQRRADLIPNLVETTRAYAAQETKIFTGIAEARAKLAGANTVAEKAQADAELSGALSRLLVVVERYPQLKSNQNFQQLADELAGTENRLAVARKDYNAAVRAYNTRIKKFPGNIVAGMAGFEPREYFEAAEGTQKAPQVKF
ncbi:LemA family protein [Syntrophomonas palmitatica]|uniref:LemA family protein n=1 Tax=Syntrophomonas palmitatica TaxID=402877 RepID=UPI0006CF49FD|nr:LemA family protein [Syntrophomonas palmitatica]